MAVLLFQNVLPKTVLRILHSQAIICFFDSMVRDSKIIVIFEKESRLPKWKWQWSSQFSLKHFIWIQNNSYKILFIATFRTNSLPKWIIYLDYCALANGCIALNNYLHWKVISISMYFGAHHELLEERTLILRFQCYESKNNDKSECSIPMAKG